MKNKINFLILFTFLSYLISLGQLYAQSMVDPPALRTILEAQDGTNAVIKKNQSQFLLGWNWGGPGESLDNALNIDTYHNYSLLDPGLNSPNYLDIKQNSKLIQPPGVWNQTVIGSRGSNSLSNSHCIHLKPSLLMNNYGEILNGNIDNTNSVFGFRTRNYGITPTEGVDANKFILNKNITNTGIIVLKDIYDGKILRWLDYQEIDTTKVDKTSHFDTARINKEYDIRNYHGFNGKQLYLSINIRAIDPNELETNLDEVILTLKLKYKLETRPINSNVVTSGESGYIKFSNFPNPGEYEISNIYGSLYPPDIRGTSRNMLIGNFTPSEDFRITKRMLKNTLHPSAPDNSITLSALAFLTGEKNENGDYKINPVLKNDWWENYAKITEYISELDVEVEYHGKVDVAIDWIRIETPRAQKFLRGDYDFAVKQVVDWTINRTREHPKQLTLFRFYGNDELIPSEWQVMRYYNKLIDGLLSIELFPWGSAHQDNSIASYLYNIDAKEFWTGTTINMILSTGVPYYKKGFNDHRSVAHLGHYLGYAGNNEFNLDYLNSEYETLLLGYINEQFVLRKKPINISADAFTREYPDHNTYFVNSTLFCAEKTLHFGYYSQPDLLFSDKPWWANLWINSQSWIVDPIKRTFTMSPYHNTNRPKTGEEIRLMTTLPLILGTK